jgi:hypothetical protein
MYNTCVHFWIGNAHAIQGKQLCVRHVQNHLTMNSNNPIRLTQAVATWISLSHHQFCWSSSHGPYAPGLPANGNADTEHQHVTSWKHQLSSAVLDRTMHNQRSVFMWQECNVVSPDISEKNHPTASWVTNPSAANMLPVGYMWHTTAFRRGSGVTIWVIDKKKKWDFGLVVRAKYCQIISSAGMASLNVEGWDLAEWLERCASIPKITGSNPSGGNELTFCSDLLLTARGVSTWALIVVASLSCYRGNTLCSQRLEPPRRAG